MAKKKKKRNIRFIYLIKSFRVGFLLFFFFPILRSNVFKCGFAECNTFYLSTYLFSVFFFSSFYSIRLSAPLSKQIFYLFIYGKCILHVRPYN